jgi:hypothetical protein
MDAQPKPRVPPGGVVTRRMAKLLLAVLLVFALLAFNSIYLSTVTLAEWVTGQTLQNGFYLWMFMVHLVLGIAITLPAVAFGAWHWKRGHHHPNRAAVRMGNVAFVAALVTLATGFLLMRVEAAGTSFDPLGVRGRSLAYWSHVAAPLVLVWAFVLHRLAGRRIRWGTGIAVATASVAVAAGFIAWHGWDAGRNRRNPLDGQAYFEPSLARTANGAFIPERSLRMNDYCVQCHQDSFHGWAHSAHAASSFNNPLYAFSVRETRKAAFEKEGKVNDARFCAGCHDPVPFFTGAFEDARFDDPAYDVSKDPLGSASITCTACHSITSVASTRGNADYVIEESPQYPFAFSESPFLQWVNRQLVFSKPAFHKATFLKPEVHRSAEFCSTCHKVFLPEELNDYKWLPGQNHYDSWRLSGRSGHGIQAWHWPKEAASDCNGCHMPLQASADPGAKPRGPDGGLLLKGHLFPGGNTATARASGLPDWSGALAATEAFNRNVLRVDVFGVTPEGGAEVAPLPDAAPALEPGRRHEVEVVVRALGAIGHAFTQGTVDSNEAWIDVTVLAGDRVIGRSGGLGEGNGVDPWSKFLNVWMLDREGKRIDRRNPQDIFVPLYDHQVQPGGAEVTRYAFVVPPGTEGPVTVEAAVRYRKFDLTYLRYVYGPERVNDLPILTMATDRVTFGAATGQAPAPSPQGAGQPAVPAAVPDWERWYDAGIGRFRTAERAGGKGQWTRADEAFRKVGDAGRAHALVARARVALREGRLADAGEHLRAAAAVEGNPVPWSVAYWSAVIDLQQGEYERAIEGFAAVSATRFPEAQARGYDFARDDRLLVEWATACLERARQLRDPADASRRTGLLREARRLSEAAIEQDRQRFATWYVHLQALEALGDQKAAEFARREYERYRPDDNARDRAVTAARSANPAADHAAEPSAVHDLQRPGAPGLPSGVARGTP